MKYATMTILLAVAALLAVQTWAADVEIDAHWESVGIGGGGGILNPSISPHDKDLIFVTSDMGGLYRSTDGAGTWRMVDGYSVRKVFCPLAFHPTHPEVIYAASRGGVKRSDDRGKTWHHVIGKFDPDHPDFPKAIAIDPGRPEVIWVYFDTYLGKQGHFLVGSYDGGHTWAPVAGWPYRDKQISRIFFNPSSPIKSRQVFIFADGELYRSDDDGVTWQLKTGQLPKSDSHRDCVAVWDRHKKTFSLFITRPSQSINQQFQGGVYKSSDCGESWEQIVNGLEVRAFNGKSQQYRRLAASADNADIVYVSSQGPDSKQPFQSTVWKSVDGGRSWKAILFGEPGQPHHNVDPDWLTLDLSWGWGGTALGMTCNPADAEDVIVTDMGRAIRTNDGGRHWFPVSTGRWRSGADAWKGHGLEVTTAYSYYFDPHDRQRSYITYTDIGMARSIDGGESWIWAGRGSPWENTCYELAFDPDRAGVIFGAWSGAHDLPHWKMLRHGESRLSGFSGGLARSIDFGATWRRIGQRNLPNAAVTTIVLDPRTPKGSRTLYAGFLNRGIYKSTDDGRTWSPKNQGLLDGRNMNIWRLALHPDGTLLCAKTIAYVDGKPVPGALFRSTDGAESWTRVNRQQSLDYIFGLRMDPRDSRIIYAACFDVPPEGYDALGTMVPWPRSKGGGVFKSTDGGRTWNMILNQPWSWDVTLDPQDPDVVYAGTFYGGVYRSADAGLTWHHLKGLPFVCAQRVTVDPGNSKIIYVTTFGGGVWKGRLP